MNHDECTTKHRMGRDITIKLKMVCCKRRKQLLLESIKNPFLMAVLKLSVKDTIHYDEEIKFL